MQRCELPAQRKRKCSGSVEIISKMAAGGVGKKLQLVTNHLGAGGWGVDGARLPGSRRDEKGRGGYTRCDDCASVVKC